MASPPPNPREGEEGDSEFKEEPSGEREAAPQKTFIAPPVSQLPTKLQFVTLGAPGPSGIKQLFRTVKIARRVPTLPRRPRDEGDAGTSASSAASTSFAARAATAASTSQTATRASIAASASAAASTSTSSAARVSSVASTSAASGSSGASASSSARASAVVSASTSTAVSTSPAPQPRTRRDHTKRHICDTCEKRFSSPGKLSQHVLSHTGELPFSCDMCDKRFNSKFKLVRHNLIHSEARAFACAVCGKTFNRKDHLTNHVRVHNPVKKLYTCERPECRKSYTSHLSYRKHAALHSAEEGNLQCKICDMTFATRQEIVYHLKVHTGSRTVKNDSDKKFTCNYCGRKFFTAKDVRRHQVVHTGRRDFLCPYCPQKFGRKDHLVRHVKNAHPDESWKSAAVGTSSEPPPEASAFEETYTDYSIEETDFSIWNPPSPKESTSEGGPTRVPSTDIIVEIAPELDIKVEPIEIKLEDTMIPEIKIEEPESPSCSLLPVEYPMMYMVGPPYSQTSPDLPYMTTEELSDPIEAHLLHQANVESLLMDPGEGPSGLSSQMLELLEESEPTYTGEEGREGRIQQRLPAFTQAFQTAQSPKPPPPPPPPH